MKAKDIKPGTVYAYRRSKYSTPQPIVFLAPVDAEHVYVTADRFRPKDAPAYRKAHGRAKPGRGSGYASPSYGYPAVVAYGDVSQVDLTAVTLADFETSTSGYDAARGISFMLVTNLGQIVGDYEEAVAAAEREKREREEAYEAEKRAHREANERAAALVAALGEHGVQARPDDSYFPNTLVLSFGEVDKLLALLNR